MINGPIYIVFAISRLTSSLNLKRCILDPIDRPSHRRDRKKEKLVLCLCHACCAIFPICFCVVLIVLLKKHSIILLHHLLVNIYLERPVLRIPVESGFILYSEALWVNADLTCLGTRE